MTQSSAPCLHDVGKETQCYRNVIKGTGYCDRHQRPAFYGNVYGTDLPRNWGQIQRSVLARDKGMCYMCLEAGRPAQGADAVEHLVPRNEGGADAPYNLKAVHHNVAPYCHREKTAQDAARARRSLQAKPRRRGMF